MGMCGLCHFKELHGIIKSSIQISEIDSHFNIWCFSHVFPRQDIWLEQFNRWLVVVSDSQPVMVAWWENFHVNPFNM